MRRLLGSLVLLLLPVLVAVPPGSAEGSATTAPGATQVDIDVPTITWEPCYEDGGPECAVVRLPLDYDDPTGPTTPVHLLRVPATGQRIGSLFVNPGGPGGSAVDFAQYAGRLIGPGVSRHFDVIGVEPRGVGDRPWALCRYSSADADYPHVSYPITRHQVTDQIRFDRAVDRGCATSRTTIVDHMSTADYVRDIDVVRQAVGDEQLTFYGISYGSLVGQTYAAMFPDRVRAIIVDGVLDPIDWTAGRDSSLPSTFRIDSGKGAYEALVSALAECDRVGRDRCPLAGHAEETWLRAYRLAMHGKLRVDGSRVRPQDLVERALFSLYSAREIRRLLIPFLRQVDRQAGSPSARVTRSVWDQLGRVQRRREAVGRYGYAAPGQRLAGSSVRPVQFEGVLCSDAVNPGDPWAWERASRRADRKQPWFGRSWTWASSLCARWPGTGGEDAFRGPWRTTTSTPLLVVGTTHDPATPISGARTANRQFAGSVLLTLNAWGHGALDSGRCVRKRMAAYLIEQRLPGPSVYCRPDRPLFP